MKQSKFFLPAFLLVSVGEIVSIIWNLQAHFIFKPAIMLTLIGYYLSMAPQRNLKVLCALFFCWVGDFLLMFTDRGELFFMLGLVAFLIGHLFYIFSFNQLVWPPAGNLLPTQKARYAFPIMLAGTGLMVVLFPSLDTMKIPVLIYSIVLMLMACYALFRLGRTSKASFLWVFMGALIFMLSDSLLAINKFHTNFQLASIAIMLTYISAQFMIVRGVVMHQSFKY